MKSIFYRVWDNENDKYFEPTYEAFNGKLEDLHLGLTGDLFMRTMDGTIHCDSVMPGRFEVEQATHRLDKSGNVIHDGDLLNLKTTFKNNMADRRFQNDTIVKVVQSNGTFIDEYTGVELWERICAKHYAADGTTYEIIGTIHQKPEEKGDNYG